MIGWSVIIPGATSFSPTLTAATIISKCRDRLRHRHRQWAGALENDSHRTAGMAADFAAFGTPVGWVLFRFPAALKFLYQLKDRLHPMAKACI
jgi:hypothetical protein